MWKFRVALVTLLALIWASEAMFVYAVPPSPDTLAFNDTYQRHDRPVEEGVVSRTWMWGPGIHGGREVYEEASNGWRAVRYYEKSRMEYHPESDDPLWNVTNGLLVVELISGQMQVGDTSFISHEPANVSVAGDDGNPGSPTYATLKPLLNAEPFTDGATITATLDAEGVVGENEVFGQYDVSAVSVGAPTNHTVASVFWEFMNSTGTIWIEREFVDDELVDHYADGQLFPNPFYATGYPITEPYWTQSEVGGDVTDVLLQCFERRCLTYTPDNPEGWQVESGNVGTHYFIWRHHELGYGFAYYGDAFEGLMGTLLYSGYPLNATIGNGETYFDVGLRGLKTLGPEECLADEAWSFVVDSLADTSMAFEGSDTGNWDRRAPYRIWLGHGMESLFNETLVRHGYAVVDEADPDPLFHDQLMQAQDQAQNESIGVWGACD